MRRVLVAPLAYMYMYAACLRDGAAAPVVGPPSTSVPPALAFSAGFTDGAVLQRGDAGAVVYGFAADAGGVKVTVAGDANYAVDASSAPWKDDSGCNATACPDPRTRPMPLHGAYVWRAQLHPQSQPGGEYTISVSSHVANDTISIKDVTYGDVYFCSGQSNSEAPSRIPGSLRCRPFRSITVLHTLIWDFACVQWISRSILPSVLMS